MTNRNNDIEELEELLTELEGQEAQLVSPYSEDDDAVTQLMDAPLSDQEWMVQVTPLDRRMMSTEQVLGELHAGRLSDKTLVWRTGMTDWLPLQRVDELAKAPRPANPLPRMAMGNLPPPPAARPASQPMWSAPSSPASAPVPAPAAMMVPPPPAAMPAAPVAMAAPAPMAMAPLPPPSEPSSSQTNTTRPVAVDFSDIPARPASPVQSKRALVALGAVGILAVFVTFYAVSGGSAKKAETDTAAAAPQAIGALQPAPAAPPTPAPSTPPPTESKPAAAPAAEAAPTEASADSDSAAVASVSGSSRTNAPARYSTRSEYRRRSRSAATSSKSESEDDTQTAPRASAEAASSSEEQTSSVADAPADDDADSNEAPKSTGKPGSTFNRDAAKAALAAAASQVKNCRPPGGPTGSGQVQVRYEPSGKVSSVEILTNKFENTTTGSCVAMVFRRAKVPEFTGAPVVVVNKSFEIP